jgi:stalled ribosome alternative rescue factor ArfA
VGSTVFIYLLEMIFKIKSEDKAAFLNRMEKQGETISSSQIKDNKLESYFEVEITNPKQLETAKAILKKSPKINTLTEMEKKKLTKNDLKEMVRQELQTALLEKKKMKGEKEMANEAMIPGVDDNLVAGLATLIGVGTPLVVSLIKGLKGKSKEEKAAFIRKASGDIERAKGTQDM